MVTALMIPYLTLAWLECDLTADLVARKEAAVKSRNAAEFAVIEKEITALVRENKLTSGKEFFDAANLFSAADRHESFFETQRVRYELNLTAAQMGEAAAQKNWAVQWDSLLVSLGRNRRLGLLDKPGQVWGGLWKKVPAPKAVTQFFTDPKKWATEMAKSANSKEIAKIMAEDQKDRESDWSKFTSADFENLRKRDKGRLRTVKGLVKAGKLATGDDYFNAALVCQHGDSFEDYALAHELSVASMMLGHRSGAWLAAASYDRMLINMGHRQRFGTQWFIVEGKQLLSPVDEADMNETERKAIGRLTLAEIRERAKKFLEKAQSTR